MHLCHNITYPSPSLRDVIYEWSSMEEEMELKKEIKGNVILRSTRGSAQKMMNRSQLYMFDWMFNLNMFEFDIWIRASNLFELQQLVQKSPTYKTTSI